MSFRLLSFFASSFFFGVAIKNQVNYIDYVAKLETLCSDGACLAVYLCDAGTDEVSASTILLSGVVMRLVEVLE